MSSRTARVEISGDVGLQEAAEIRRQLLEALDGADDICIDVSGVTGAHLCLVQLIEATRKSAVATDRTLTLAAPAHGALENVLRRAGQADAFWGLSGSNA